MPELHDALTNALRDELQEYGRLLALFDDQQTAILRRQPDAVLAMDEAVKAQTRAIHARRTTREKLVEDFARAHAQPEKATLRSLVPYFPEEMQALAHALIDEINRVLARSKRRVEQNKMLLARSIDMIQQLMQTAQPTAVMRTYSPQGKMTLGLSAVANRARAKV